VRADELPPGAHLADVRLFPTAPPRRFATSPSLARALRDEVERFDVVHIHSLWLYPSLVAARAAHAHGVPYVISTHGMLDPYLRRRGRARKGLTQAIWQNRALRRAALLHFTADDEARLAADVVPVGRHAVIPNPIDWESFQDLPDGHVFRRDRLGGHEGPVVLALGRLSRKKAHDVLVRAFARVLEVERTAVLAIVGPDDDGLKPELHALARGIGIGDRVVFTGSVSGPERLGALAAADVFALPSHGENFAVAVVEALAAGVAAVISPGINIAPELGRAHAAVIAEPADEPFAAALLELLSDDSARRSVGERGREFTRGYDRREVAGRFHEAYGSILAHAVPRQLSLDAARA
jgi:glycosyltransferase involved in cell wall biosynthesis